MVHVCLAQAGLPQDVAPWAQLGGIAVITWLLIWMITKAFPDLMERHEVKQAEARQHFETILNKIESNRMASAKEGHDAAKTLGSAMNDQCENLRENTLALEQINRTLQLRGSA